MKRRRFIQISALAPALLTPACDRVREAQDNKPQQMQWRGILLGTNAQITFQQISPAQAQQIFYQITQEVKRLENLFSLYEMSSVLSILNTNGKVLNTQPEFSELVRRALNISAITEGVFDPTIQSYWTKLQVAHSDNHPLTDAERKTALELVNYRDVLQTGTEIKYAKPGMQMTLNGIAQGFITDKIHDQLKSLGFTNVLINLGEFRALGAREGTKPWKLHLREGGKYGHLAGEIIELTDGALAVSSGAGYKFSATSDEHHIISPLDGRSLPADRTVAITAPDATTADALSTTCAIVSPEKAAALVERFKGAQIIHDSMVS